MPEPKVIRTIELPVSIDERLRERALRLGRSVESAATIAIISALLQEELEKPGNDDTPVFQ